MPMFVGTPHQPILTKVAFFSLHFNQVGRHALLGWLLVSNLNGTGPFQRLNQLPNSQRTVSQFKLVHLLCLSRPRLSIRVLLTNLNRLNRIIRFYEKLLANLNFYIQSTLSLTTRVSGLKHPLSSPYAKNLMKT